MNPLLSATSDALLHFLWQGTAIALMLAAALRLARRSAPRVRYVLAVLALAVMALAPVATAIVSGIPVAAPPLTTPQETTATPGVATGLPVSIAVTDEARRALVDRALLERAALAAWLLGVIALTCFNAGGWWQLRRVRRSAIALDDPVWVGRVAALGARLGIHRRVRVLLSRRVDVPTLIGAIRPTILLPVSALSGIPPRTLEALLLHELAHVRRHDFLVNALQQVVETLLFYHPAVWWVSRVVRDEREHCCDDVAAARCDRRDDYVRALADMERLRIRIARPAVSAGGGSLVARIRRLTASESPDDGGLVRWTAGLLVAGAALAFLVVQVAPVSSFAADRPAPPAPPAAPEPIAEPAPAAPPSPRAEPSPIPEPAPVAMPEPGTAPRPIVSLAPARTSGDRIEGTYRTEPKRDGGVQLQMNVDNDRGKRHQMSLWIDRDELSGVGDATPGFSLVRDAGTFEFSGELGDRKEGTFAFRPNRDYLDAMRSYGFRVESGDDDRLFELAALDVSLEFAAGIARAGYDDISFGKLVEFRIHGVTPEFVQAMADSGFDGISANRLVEFKIHGVSPEFVRAMAESGFDGLSANRLVEFKIHGVTPEFVRGMADSGFEDLTANRLVEFRIHGVTPEFVRGIAETGLGDIGAARLVEFRIHGVTPEFVRRAQERYGRDLSASEIVEMRIHGRV